MIIDPIPRNLWESLPKIERPRRIDEQLFFPPPWPFLALLLLVLALD
jgi:hypothetical protein